MSFYSFLQYEIVYTASILSFGIGLLPLLIIPRLPRELQDYKWLVYGQMVGFRYNFERQKSHLNNSFSFCTLSPMSIMGRGYRLRLGVTFHSLSNKKFLKTVNVLATVTICFLIHSVAIPNSQGYYMDGPLPRSIPEDGKYCMVRKLLNCFDWDYKASDFLAAPYQFRNGQLFNTQ